ncbi:MAG: hypothetical protein HZB43_04300 [candidate division Zixibacteria bacterium]|nr:hypothetical protein [candidate division Zixibacteria bacterium]
MKTRQDCPGGVDWDRFVLDPSIPSHAAMARHLADCEYCQIVVAESQRVWDKVLAGMSAQSAAQEHTAGVITLRFIPDLTMIPPVSALAAKGLHGDPEPSSLTLASPDRTIWLRVVRDKHTRDVWLYLHAEEESVSCANAMVQPFGLEESFIADEQGRVNLGQAPWPASETIQAEVRVPKASFRLMEVSAREQPAGETTLKSVGGDEIRLSWTGEKRHHRLTIGITRLSGMPADAPIKLAVRTPGQTRPLHVATIPPLGTTGMDSEADLAALEIYIYQ